MGVVGEMAMFQQLRRKKVSDSNKLPLKAFLQPYRRASPEDSTWKSLGLGSRAHERNGVVAIDVKNSRRFSNGSTPF
jgi:hypothetical protein